MEAKSSIYGQLGGIGFTISLNYEYFISDDMPLRIGLGLPSIPINLSKLVGESRHKLEFGGGIILPDMISGVVGYRYQPEISGPIFRLSFTPLISSGFIAPFFV